MHAQQLNIPLNQQLFGAYERELLKSTEYSHHSFKPLKQESHWDKSDYQRKGLDVLNLSKPENDYSFLRRKLLHEHLILIDTSGMQISIDPILNLELGEDVENTYTNNLYKNTRGFVVRSNIGKKFSFESSFRENQAFLPLYVANRTNSSGVAYGQGRVKKFKEDGFDFSMSSAYVSFTPTKNINIQTGHGKHFVGNGHRSLLLSDLSFNYPYLRINSTWLNNRLNYQNLYTSFQDLNRLPGTNSAEALFERKLGSFHFVEYSFSKRLNIGLFEGIIWPSLDSGGNVNVGANYWMPLLGANTLLEGRNKNGNSLLGMNTNYKFSPSVLAYAQYAIFDEEISQSEFQIGMKWYQGNYWTLQLEYNHSERNQKNHGYHHYNESLALPVEGSNEYFANIQYRKDRWLSNLSFNYILSEQEEITFADIRQSYIVNPSTNLAISAGVQLRNGEINGNTIENNEKTLFIYVGLRTSLQNLYFNY